MNEEAFSQWNYSEHYITQLPTGVEAIIFMGGGGGGGGGFDESNWMKVTAAREK